MVEFFGRGSGGLGEDGDEIPTRIKKREIQGDPSLNRSIVSLRSLIKTVDVVLCGAVWA